MFPLNFLDTTHLMSGPEHAQQLPRKALVKAAVALTLDFVSKARNFLSRERQYQLLSGNSAKTSGRDFKQVQYVHIFDANKEGWPLFCISNNLL